jgi:hypothetical protein
MRTTTSVPLASVVRRVWLMATSSVNDAAFARVIERVSSPAAIEQYVDTGDAIEAYQAKTDKELVDDLLEELEDAVAYGSALADRDPELWLPIIVQVAALICTVEVMDGR